MSYSGVGYVDIHSHIIYGVDDGAAVLEDSLSMLSMASDTGTTDIVATPHANGRYTFDPMIVERRVAELARLAPTIRIYPGCDFHLQPDNVEDAIAHPEKYTINHQKYLLVEFSNLGTLPDAPRMLGRLLDAGMIPIITHPERHALLQRRLDDLAEWVRRGSLVQVTAASFTGLFGRRAQTAADALLRRGLVHFVASDAHDVTFRRPSLEEAYVRLADNWGEETTRPLFVENPRATLTGDTLPFAPVVANARKWYQFWN